MGDILIRGLSKWTIDRLKQRAKENGRSLQSELRLMIERETGRVPMEELMEEIRAIRESMPPSADSVVDLIREDRER